MLLRSATTFPCNNKSELCLADICRYPKRCTLRTEYESIEFDVTDPAELAAALQASPKTFPPRLCPFLIIRITGHPFNLRVSSLGGDIFQILPLPPAFLLDPHGLSNHLATERLLSRVAQSSGFTFSVLGLLGTHFHNFKLQRVFQTIRSVNFCQFLEDRIGEYNMSWRGEKPPDVRQRNGILSEKEPRRPVDRPRCKKKAAITKAPFQTFL